MALFCGDGAAAAGRNMRPKKGEAELAEIFQWQTPEESRLALEDAAANQRIGEEVADVLLYLLQVADHCQVDLSQAVRYKLARKLDPAGVGPRAG